MTIPNWANPSAVITGVSCSCSLPGNLLLNVAWHANIFFITAVRQDRCYLASEHFCSCSSRELYWVWSGEI